MLPSEPARRATSNVERSLFLLIRGHMKSIIYEIPVESQEDLMAQLWLRRALDSQVFLIVYTRTDTMHVLKSLVVTSSPSCRGERGNVAHLTSDSLSRIGLS